MLTILTAMAMIAADPAELRITNHSPRPVAYRVGYGEGEAVVARIGRGESAVWSANDSGEGFIVHFDTDIGNGGISMSVRLPTGCRSAEFCWDGKCEHLTLVPIKQPRRGE